MSKKSDDLLSGVNHAAVSSFHAGASFDFFKPKGPDTTSISDWEPSLTRQEFAEECDVNLIMARYEKGELPNLMQRTPHYLDLASQPQSLMEAMAVFHAAETAFMSLPAQVRKEFDNDPIKFSEFAGDPENLDQMRKWGLAAPEPVQEPPMRVEVINPAPPAGDSPEGDSRPS